MDAGTEVSLLGGLSRPVAFLVLILAFLAGAWVGRGSVLLETRARRRHLDEAVGKIVAGVVEGLKATSGVPTPAPTNVAADAVTPIVRGVLAGLATPRRNADADSGAAATNDDGSASREGSGMASPATSSLEASGSTTVMVVPRPGSESMVRPPPWPRMMPWITDMPRPRPVSLVLKKGS